MNETHNFDWSDLAFGSKRSIRELNATFILASREISSARFTQIVKEYLPHGNIVLGISKEPYVNGFEDQPQFRTLQQSSIQTIIDKVNSSPSPHKIYTLHYFQRETTFILEKIAFKQVLNVHGSQKFSFHQTQTFYSLTQHGIPFTQVPAYTDSREAKATAKSLEKELSRTLNLPNIGSILTEEELFEAADAASKQSFDWTFQTGVALGKRENASQYKLLALTCNPVIPYQTYSQLHGSLREKNYSPANDLNYYDTVHAEVELLIYAQRNKLDLSGTTLCINLLPCPTCARMISETDIAEVLYKLDHSDGYAYDLLSIAGKTVRRIETTKE